MKKIYFLLLAFSFFSVTNAQIVNIPDARFKQMLLTANSTTNKIATNLSGAYFKIDANNDSQIQESEALNVSYLYLYNYETAQISDLTGIQNFRNLNGLNCSNNQLTSLNVSSLINLTYLDCDLNQLTSLDVSSLVNLTKLSCSENQLTSLNVSTFVNLTSLYCYSNQLTSLDVSSLVNLTTLSCFDNQLTSLNVDYLVNLDYLDCSYNQLTSLNVASLVYLTSLFCSYNQLTSLNVAPLVNLTSLFCSDNQLNSLDVAPLFNLTSLFCSDNQLNSLDVDPLVNLTSFNCGRNKLNSLNVAPLINLEFLFCSGNQLTSLNVTSLVNLTKLACIGNKLTSLDVSKNINLFILECKNNLLTSLNIDKLSELNVLICGSNLFETIDASNLKFLYRLQCENNPNLVSVFVKGNDFSVFDSSFKDNPKLAYVCANEKDVASFIEFFSQNAITGVNVNSYCSFNPGGTFYTIQGNQKLDSNNNGCDPLDVAVPNLKYTITDSSVTGSFISDTSGNYSIPVQAGTHTISPKLENPTYFTVFPATVNVTFPTQTSPFTQNFCITPNGVRPDLEVTLLPLQPARPGFDAKYKLVYKNKGNTIQSGSVNLSFNDSVLDLVVANPVASSQTANNLSWNFTTLQPFETREISFTMNVNSPQETPAVNNGNILVYTAAITSLAVDETPTDNTFTFNQTVVGSYDPNDKTCLEGSVITPNLIGQYVHYTIRFENTGTFAAENVVVKDMIDLTKFDISTLVPTSASHSYTTRISDGNKVEFIFENINLPFDDANNDGYIAFKIKTKPTLVVNDTFSNEANIYFDYNFPILTNKATSTFKTLGTQDFDFDRYFTVYPNPAKADLNITAKETINVNSISVYNTLGQLVLALPNAAKVSTIDVSSLTAGNYFIQIKTDKGSSSSQFVKE